MEAFAEALIPLIAIPAGCATTVFLFALLFPTTRHAMANWLHRRSSGGLDPEAVTTQLASANAQLAAVRGEVYALRCELAALTQALPATVRPAALPPGPGANSPS